MPASDRLRRLTGFAALVVGWWLPITLVTPNPIEPPFVWIRLGLAMMLAWPPFVLEAARPTGSKWMRVAVWTIAFAVGFLWLLSAEVPHNYGWWMSGVSDVVGEYPFRVARNTALTGIVGLAAWLLLALVPRALALRMGRVAFLALLAMSIPAESLVRIDPQAAALSGAWKCNHATLFVSPSGRGATDYSPFEPSDEEASYDVRVDGASSDGDRLEYKVRVTSSQVTALRQCTRGPGAAPPLWWRLVGYRWSKQRTWRDPSEVVASPRPE